MAAVVGHLPMAMSEKRGAVTAKKVNQVELCFVVFHLDSLHAATGGRVYSVTLPAFFDGLLKSNLNTINCSYSKKPVYLTKIF